MGVTVKEVVFSGLYTHASNKTNFMSSKKILKYSKYFTEMFFSVSRKSAKNDRISHVIVDQIMARYNENKWFCMGVSLLYIDISTLEVVDVK